MSEVRVAAPDPSWGAAFQREATRVRAAFGEQAVEIHPIGSTAIDGIYAKPIIDILLLVDDLAIADAGTLSMQGLGYEACGEFGIPGRRYFRKNNSNGVRTHQVHSFVRESDEARRHIAFRDYMNAHASVAQEYSVLKQRLAKEFPSDMEAYIDGKDEFIKRHEARALAEQISQ